MKYSWLFYVVKILEWTLKYSRAAGYIIFFCPVTCFLRMLFTFIIDQFPYHVWVGEYKRSVVGDTAEKIHTIVKMVLHESYNSSSFKNDIGIVNSFSEQKHSFSCWSLKPTRVETKIICKQSSWKYYHFIPPWNSMFIHQQTLRAVFIFSDQFTFWHENTNVCLIIKTANNRIQTVRQTQ